MVIETIDENKKKELNEVMTTKECESLYDLPVNTVLQDIRRGRLNISHVRQSNKTWLITRAEANRVYSQYKQERRRNKQ